jgi:hypothetical protein
MRHDTLLAFIISLSPLLIDAAFADAFAYYAAATIAISITLMISCHAAFSACHFADFSLIYAYDYDIFIDAFHIAADIAQMIAIFFSSIIDCSLYYF